jgi:predicted small metal-binding protein
MGGLVSGFSFACRDLGRSCEWALRAPSVEEIESRFREHARCAHQLREIDAGLAAALRAAIRPRAA